MRFEAMPHHLALRLRAAAACSRVTIGPDTLPHLWEAAQLLAQLARGSGVSGYEDAEDALMRGLGPALAYLSCDDAPRRGDLADLGAGNGALGCGIALLCPELSVTLVDRARRAHTMCELLAARLRLPNLQACLYDVKRSGPPARPYDGIVFRALAHGSQALALAASQVRAGGFIGAYHRAGDPAYTQAEGARLRPLGSVNTLVDGLVLSGFLVLPAGSPQ